MEKIRYLYAVYTVFTIGISIIPYVNRHRYGKERLEKMMPTVLLNAVLYIAIGILISQM